MAGIVFDPEGNIVVGFGDHELDGVRYPEVASQNVQSSYGKLIGIDLQTLESRLIGTGLRNPQGLLRDRDGNILATDHGPQGGDEINLVRAGANFGWPFVTYGTDYNHDEWPLSSVQGSHEDYTLPLFAWVPSIGISNLIQIGGTPQRVGRGLTGFVAGVSESLSGKDERGSGDFQRARADWRADPGPGAAR